MATFVRKNRARWERLEKLLSFLERRQVKQLDRPTLHELSHLYRASTSDLAFAQTYYPGTTLLLFLHQLVGRAHHQIYRTEGITAKGITDFFRNDIPRITRKNFDFITLSAILFLAAFALGLAAVQADERVAHLVLPTSVIEDIYSGRMWTRSIFSAVPSSVSSTIILSNNITVAFWCFVGGMSCGVITTLILVLNGFILGAAFKLCAQHGLLFDLLEFVASHALVEISTIILAGASGFVLASALLSPGNLSRADALSVRGQDAMRLALACIPPLFAIGIVEGFISPSQSIPLWFKITLGVSLFTAFWAYLLLSGKKKGDESGKPKAQPGIASTDTSLEEELRRIHETEKPA
ncbi:MAG: stage II sporulation protein M [Candidatus Methylacidiphilales bacterium]|nr:stage II sporulation protein M [Candidatus Methylacidiphilales bacterium]